jgi:hypothetical protein
MSRTNPEKKKIDAALKVVERQLKQNGVYLGTCVFSPYGKTDGFGRPVVGCACGGGIDTYDGDCTCCGSQSCSSRKECLKTQRDRIVWDVYIQRKYPSK